MACVEDDLREREADEFGKGLDRMVKLDLYRRGNLKALGHYITSDCLL